MKNRCILLGRRLIVRLSSEDCGRTFNCRILVFRSWQQEMRLENEQGTAIPGTFDISTDRQLLLWCVGSFAVWDLYVTSSSRFEPLHTSECRCFLLGKGTCWLICTLTRGKIEQWFVTHTCYQFCKRNMINTKRSGVIQSSEGLNWLSILIIRSEMVSPETRCINKSPWCSFPAFLQGKSPGSARVGGPLIALNSAAVLWVRCSLCWPKHHFVSLLPLMILTKMRFRIFSTVPFFNTQSFCAGTRFGPWRAQGPKCCASRRFYNYIMQCRFSLSQVASGRVLQFDDPDKMDQSRHDTRRHSSLKGRSEITKVLRLKYGPYLATSILFRTIPGTRNRKLKRFCQRFDMRFRTSDMVPFFNAKSFPQEQGLAREGHRVLNDVLPEGFTINAMPF